MHNTTYNEFFILHFVAILAKNFATAGLCHYATQIFRSAEGNCPPWILKPAKLIFVSSSKNAL